MAIQYLTTNKIINLIITLRNISYFQFSIAMGVCCCKDGKNEPWTRIKVINHRWKIERYLAEGGYGYVCLVTDITSKSNRQYAIKIEKLKYPNDVGRLMHEYIVIHEIRKQYKEHLPEPIDRGTFKIENQPGKYLVMTLLGPNLARLAEMCPREAMSPTTCAVIALQSLECLEQIHNAGFLHRDIKPGNMVVGLGSHKHDIYIIDFGFARKFKDERELLPQRSWAPIRGTRPYMSVNMHEGGDHSARDDLWSLFYSLVHLRSGFLPWYNIISPRKVGKIKKKIIVDRWLEDVEKEYITFFDYLTDLDYSSIPDYNYITKLFDKMLVRLKETFYSPLDWEVDGPQYSKLDQSKLKKMFFED